MEIIKEVLSEKFNLDKTKQYLICDNSKKINYDKENCDHFQKYLTYFSVKQMAMLWCDIEISDFEDVISECEYPRRAIPKHPYIGCLEHRASAIMDAIEARELAVGRDGRNHQISDEHVAPERRTVQLKDFKEWLIITFPNEKPKLIFDEIERKAHKSITTDVYLSLLADRDHLTTRIKKAEEVYKEQKIEINKLQDENNKLKTLAPLGDTDDRSENTYLNIIGGLVNLMPF